MYKGGMIILSNRAFGVFWAARTISSFGDSMAQVALMLLAYHLNQGPSVVSLLLMAQVVPRFLGPFTGILADKFDQKKMMIGCDVVQLVLFASMALTHPPFVILLVLVSLSALVSTVSSPLGSSAIPALVGHEEFLSANLFLRSSQNIGMLCAPTVGGAVSAVFGPHVVLLIDSCTFLVCAVIIMTLPTFQSSQPSKVRILKDTVEGLSYIVKTTVVRNLVFSLWIYVALAAVSNLALVFLAQVSLHSGDRGYGVLTSAYGMGMLIGSVVLYKIRNRVLSTKALLIGLSLWGAGAIFTGLSPVLGLTVVALVISAVGNTFENVATDTVVQQIVPENLLGRVFSTLFNGMQVASGVAYFIGAPLLRFFSARQVYVGSGTVVCIFVLVMIRVLHRTELRATNQGDIAVGE